MKDQNRHATGQGYVTGPPMPLRNDGSALYPPAEASPLLPKQLETWRRFSCSPSLRRPGELQ